jgi:hypothetical protein
MHCISDGDSYYGRLTTQRHGLIDCYDNTSGDVCYLLTVGRIVEQDDKFVATQPVHGINLVHIGKQPNSQQVTHSVHNKAFEYLR